MLGDGGGEGDDVVLRDLLDFLDAVDTEAGARADARAIASTAAISTCSQVSYFRWSLQMRPISGFVYLGIIPATVSPVESSGR